MINPSAFTPEQLLQLASLLSGGGQGAAPRALPIAERTIILPENMVRIRVWVHGPTSQFPQPGCFLGVSSPKGNTYTKLTVEELAMLGTAISAWATELRPLLISQTVHAYTTSSQAEVTDVPH